MTIQLEIEGKIARLILDRPEKRNALSMSMLSTMLDHLDRLEALAADGLRAVVVHSSQPDMFCAGADIAEFASNAGEKDWRVRNQHALFSMQRRLTRLPMAVIAAIGGDCIGAGCGLALACDLRIASGRARFGITPAKLGLVYPLHDTKLLVDLVGPGQAKRILFTASLFSAHQASEMGLIEILAEDPLSSAMTAAETIATLSGTTIRHSKAMIKRIVDGACDDDDLSQQIFMDAFDGPDFREGVNAFLARRSPQFD